MALVPCPSSVSSLPLPAPLERARPPHTPPTRHVGPNIPVRPIPEVPSPSFPAIRRGLEQGNFVRSSETFREGIGDRYCCLHHHLPRPHCPEVGRGSGSSKGGKGISGREGTGYGGLGCKGEGEKGSLGYLDPRAVSAGLAPSPLQNFNNFPGKPPGVCFLILGNRYLDLNSRLLGDPGVQAPNNSCRTFDQIRAKLLLLLCPPPPFPSPLLLFLKESSKHPKALHLASLTSGPLCFSVSLLNIKI